MRRPAVVLTAATITDEQIVLLRSSMDGRTDRGAKRIRAACTAALATEADAIVRSLARRACAGYWNAAANAPAEVL